jgi:retinol dehydrogenase-12
MKSPGNEFVGRNFHYGFETSVDGFESHIGVNHIGHFYLTQLLVPVLQRSAPARVVAVSSLVERASFPEGLRFETWKPTITAATTSSNTSYTALEVPMDYEDGVAYAQSKLANLLFARELAARLEGTGVTTYSCHPGVIKSELTRYMAAAMEDELKDAGWLQRKIQMALGGFFELAMMEVADGALTQLHLATANASDLVNGGNYHPIGRYMGDHTHPQASNETLQKLLWTESERLIAEAGF